MRYFLIISMTLFLAACPHQASRQSLNTAYDLRNDKNYSGTEFFERCGHTTTETKEKQRERDVCVWYISNVTIDKEVKKITCFPQRPSARERHDLVVKYINKNTDKHHLTAREIIIEAMNNTYPCA